MNTLYSSIHRKPPSRCPLHLRDTSLNRDEKFTDGSCFGRHKKLMVPTFSGGESYRLLFFKVLLFLSLFPFWEENIKFDLNQLTMYDTNLNQKGNLVKNIKEIRQYCKPWVESLHAASGRRHKGDPNSSYFKELRSWSVSKNILDCARCLVNQRRREHDSNVASDLLNDCLSHSQHQQRITYRHYTTAAPAAPDHNSGTKSVAKTSAASGH